MNIFILSGAGLSAESGLGTFRDIDGLWTRYDLNEVCTPEGFDRDPALVHEFYNLRRADLFTAQPNAAHIALAWLQSEISKRGGRVTLCTQNVDDMLEQAGADEVIHMHGALRRVRCVACGHECDWLADLGVATPCPACHTVGHMRPAIVWFGEMPLAMDLIEARLFDADLFLSIGTSGNVYPAAGFVEAARREGARTVELNLEPSANAYMFDEGIYGPASEITPPFVETLLAGKKSM